MKTILGGRCVKVGESVNTDVIMPARYLISIDPKELADHAFEPLGAEFHERFVKSKIVVAGKNFGCGSAREQAASCLVGAGIEAVVAASFARVFFRNAINTGLPAIECPEAAYALSDDDEVEIDLVEGVVRSNGKTFKFNPFPSNLQRIMEAGGLVPYLEKHVLPGAPDSRSGHGTPPTSGMEARTGRTFVEKVLGRAAGVPHASSGDILDVYPTLCMSHNASWRCIRTLEKLRTEKLFDPHRIALVMDHKSPAPSMKVAADQKLCRQFARERGIKTFYDVNAGIAHIVLMENGHVKPGDVLIGTDSHSTIYGALGAFGTGVGFSEVTATWVTGKLWMKVPETIRVNISGPLAPGVGAKDIMLKLIGDISADGATYKSVEFHGSYIEGLSVSERMTLCNLAMELGAKCAYVPPDEIVRQYLLEVGIRNEDYAPIYPDDDARYEAVIEIDGSTLTPQIACPHTVDNVKPIGEVVGTKVDQVFIGSCANAKFEDLVEAARILKGRKVASGVRLIITPASKGVVDRILEAGVYRDLLEAGGLLTNPGCGACAGDGALMSDGEVTLSTANRNFPGRMGSYHSEIYLASPAVAAATAVTGAITSPLDFLQDVPMSQ